MPSTFSIAPADQSVRWSVMGDAMPSYEVLVTSRSDRPVLCSLVFDEPAGAGTIDPKSFTIMPGETRSARLSFDRAAVAAQTKRARISARSADGAVLASLERDIDVGGETDCNIGLAWQRPVLENGALRGFVLSCSLKNTGSTRARFEPQFSKHPALHFETPAPVTLDANATADVPATVTWDQSVRDMIGKNHPEGIEVWVETTKGRRASRMPWQIIDEQCASSLRGVAGAATVAAAAATATAAMAEPKQARPPAQTLTAPAQKPAQPTVQTPAGAPVAPAPAKEAWMQRLPEPPPVSPLASAVTIVSDEERRAATAAARPHPRRDPAVRYSTLILSAIGILALVFAILIFLRPSQQAPAITSITQITPLPAAQISLPPLRPSAVLRTPAAANANAKATQSPAPAATPTSATGAQTLAAQTPAPSPIATAAVRRVAAAPNQNVRAMNLSEPVSLYNVDASLERAGRAVRVNWASSGQASAQIQLTNASGRIIGARLVRGGAQSSLLFLPRGYRGPVYVQLVAFGRRGDRVTESTQLGGF